MLSPFLTFFLLFIYINGYLSGFIKNFSPSLFFLILLLFAGSFEKKSRKDLFYFAFFIVFVMFFYTPLFWRDIKCNGNITAKVIIRSNFATLIEDGHNVNYLVSGTSLFPGRIRIFGKVRSEKGVFGGNPYRCRLRPEKFSYIEENDTWLESWKLRNITFMGDMAGSFVNGVLFGDRREIPDKLSNIFSRLGLSHILAISGLHVGFAFAIGYLIFMLFFREIPFILDAALVIPLSALGGTGVAIFYYLVSGMQTSARRAVVVLLLYVISLIMGRKVNSLHIFQLAALIVLLINPFELFSLSFQLSFLAYGIILVLLKRLPSGWMQATVPVIMLPITSFIFGIFPLFSPVANLLFIPIFGTIVFPGMILGQLLSFMNDRFLIISGVTINFVFKVLLWVDHKLPQFYFLLPFNWVVALLVPFAVAIFRPSKLRFLIVIFLFIQIFLGVSYLAGHRRFLIKSEDSLDVYLRTLRLTDKIRNRILRNTRVYPVFVEVQNKNIVIRKGIFCKSFFLDGGKCYSRNQCDLGDVLTSFFEPVTENLSYALDHM